MNHPFTPDLTNKTTDQLLDDINNLNNKISYMYKIGKHDMVRQISMLLNTYKAEYTKRQEEMFAKKQANMQDKIKIS